MRLSISVMAIVVALTAAGQVNTPADQPTSKPTLRIVGDSAVRNGTNGKRGWGEEIGKFFDPGKIKIEHHAIGACPAEPSSPTAGGKPWPIKPSRATTF